MCLLKYRSFAGTLIIQSTPWLKFCDLHQENLRIKQENYYLLYRKIEMSKRFSFPTYQSIQSLKYPKSRIMQSFKGLETFLLLGFIPKFDRTRMLYTHPEKILKNCCGQQRGMKAVMNYLKNLKERLQTFHDNITDLISL